MDDTIASRVVGEETRLSRVQAASFKKHTNERRTFERKLAAQVEKTLQFDSEEREALDKAEACQTCSVCWEVKDAGQGVCPVTAQKKEKFWGEHGGFPQTRYVHACSVITCSICVPCARQTLRTEIGMEEALGSQSYKRRCPGCLVEFDRFFDNFRSAKVTPRALLIDNNESDSDYSSDTSSV